MIQLWNVINNKVTFNEDELVVIGNVKCFRELYNLFTVESDRLKIFTFIWLVADYRSPLIQKGLVTEELFIAAKDKVGYDNNFQVTKQIELCINTYRQLEYDVIEEQFVSIKQAYHSTAKIIQVLNNNNQKIIMREFSYQMKVVLIFSFFLFFFLFFLCLRYFLFK